MLLSVKRRLTFLAVGNSVLLVAIYLLLKEGGSFRVVLERIGPDLAPVLLAGLGMTALIFTGAIDLSIGSSVALAGTVFGICVYHQCPPLLAFAACALTGFGVAVLNSALIKLLALPAIIVTLAGLPFYRGLALLLADISIPRFGGNISVQSGEYLVPGKVYAGSIALIAMAGALVVERWGKLTREFLALGCSKEACALMGLRPNFILQKSFLAAGIFFGLAALVYATRIQAIEPSRIALGFELQVIAAVILGGSHIFGGSGSFIGTVLGALFLYLVSQALVYAGASAYIQDAISGALIMLVIGIDCALYRKNKRLEELA